MIGSSEKASHYISELDTARVNAAWSEFPELIRKVNKHAPQRKVLIHTATAEHEVATGIRTSAARPTTGSGTHSSSPLSTLYSTLQSVGEPDTEDSFQGKTCLLWSRWVGVEGNAATAGFDTAAAARALEGQKLTAWTKICLVKSAYMEGTYYVKNGRPTEARRLFNFAVPSLQLNQELILSTPQLAYWAEQLLAQLALNSMNQAEANATDTAQMEAFRYWGVICSKTREVSASTFRNSAAHLSRVSVWRRYYNYLSAALRTQAQDNVYMSSALRLQQSTELRKVERAYENELLRIIKFPAATETNAVVEQWVEQAVLNWQILCGPQWRDVELGEGGRNAIARNMLDILYRAATKTFHSTLILRRLFQVHLSLSEFDLAYRAFDTYIELVDRGRARVAKSEKPESGHESDETVLTTMSEAIAGLCKFSRHSEAYKAYELCLKLEDWLAEMGIEIDELDRGELGQNGYLNGDSASAVLGPQILQTIYRTIGTGKAHWARWTPASETRSVLQEEALASLRQACCQDEPEIETLYAMSLLLAEMRDITGAVQAAKQALAKNTSSSTTSSGWAMERKLIPQWHLLALLLSSRQDFDSAVKSCTAAFEQFASSDLHLGPGRNSSISSDIEKQFNMAVSTFTGEMETNELQRIIEVRITELALTELVDGPEEALNCSNELLGLFSRLFAHLQIPHETPSTVRNLVPPKSSAGTMKSSRMSIFGRRKHENTAEPLREKSDDVASVTTNTTRPSTRAAQAPTIQVTNEDEKPPDHKHHFRRSHDSSHARTTADGGTQRLSHRFSQRSQGDRHSQMTEQNQSLGQTRASQNIPIGNLPDVQEMPTPVVPLEHEQSVNSKRELPEIGHNLDSHDRVPPPASHEEQPPQQDVRLPTVHTYTHATSPPVRFPKAAAQRQALTVLTKVWLVIATLYRRASMFEDSKEACEEAGKAAAKVEAIVAAIDHSARALAEAGWGAGTKSADEVWADVYCERAELQLAIYNRKVIEGQSSNNDELRAAVDQYEQCLMFVPNHPAGVVGISNILLDSYERKIDLGHRANAGRLHLAEQDSIPSIVVTNDSTAPSANGTTSPRPSSAGQAEQQAHLKTDEDLKKTPENLNRIAARDRAYGLLSTLTKLGTGWDDSAAWFALARAHELGGEIEKAKSILWWCIELEDTKPIRHWRNLGYSL